MNIHLIFNETSGDGEQSIPDIIEKLERYGAHVVAFDKKSSDLKQFLKRRCDLLLIAGGDGSVGKVLKKMVDHPLPFAILPLGNANNIAESLQVDEYLGKLVSNWKANKFRPFSLGYIDNGEKVKYFLESIGWGLFASTLHKIKKEKSRWRKGPKDKVAFGLVKLGKGLNDLEAARYEINIDGKDYSGEYLWIEVMNIPYMGPNLELAPESDAKDRWLDVILIKKGEEEKIRKLIQNQEQKNWHQFDLAVKAKEVQIKETGLMHIDDKIKEADSKKADSPKWLKIGLHSRPFQWVPDY